MKNAAEGIKASFRRLGALAGGEKKPRRRKTEPRLLEENKLAWRIFLGVKDQLIVDSGGVIAVNQEPWKLAFRVHRVPEYRELETWEKLVLLGEIYVERVNDAGKRKGAGRSVDDEG